MSTTTGRNSAGKTALLESCYQLGQTEGSGALARADFCDLVTARAKDGDAVPDDTAEYWANFQKGAQERPGRELGGPVPDEIEQRASDLKHYVTLGANALLDGPEMLANARLILKGMRDDGTAKGLKTWDAMLIWVRAQNKSPERALTDNEIENLFLARAKRARDELDLLTGVANVLAKQCKIYEDERQAQAEARAEAEEKGEDYDGPAEDDEPAGVLLVERALEYVRQRIAELGGTRKEQRKAERARAKAAKKAALDAAKAAAAAA